MQRATRQHLRWYSLIARSKTTCLAFAEVSWQHPLVATNQYTFKSFATLLAHRGALCRRRFFSTHVGSCHPMIQLQPLHLSRSLQLLARLKRASQCFVVQERTASPNPLLRKLVHTAPARHAQAALIHSGWLGHRLGRDLHACRYSVTTRAIQRAARCITRCINN